MTPEIKPHVVIIGAGMAGSACAQGLLRAGWRVSVFEKSRGAGGRMATRRARWVDAQGQDCAGAFDHGAPHFHAEDPRFVGALKQAQSQGQVMGWEEAQAWLSTPEQPSWTKQMLHGAELQAQHTVTALHRTGGVWRVQVAERAPGELLGPFDAMVLAIPAIQAAALLKDVHPAWAQAARAVPQLPVWTLMAALSPSQVPDSASRAPAILQPGEGPLDWIVRQDLKPTRQSPPAWVAHATLEWTLQHLEDSAEAVQAELLSALEASLFGQRTGSVVAPQGQAHQWAHTAVHRWRYGLVGPSTEADASSQDWSCLPCLWDAGLALGVAGDAFAGERRRETGVQRAWLSGVGLADAMQREIRDADHP